MMSRCKWCKTCTFLFLQTINANSDNILSNIQKADTLVAATEDLSENAFEFKKKSNEVKSKTRAIYIALIIVLVLIICLVISAIIIGISIGIWQATKNSGGGSPAPPKNATLTILDHHHRY